MASEIDANFILSFSVTNTSVDKNEIAEEEYVSN